MFRNKYLYYSQQVIYVYVPLQSTQAHENILKTIYPVAPEIFTCMLVYTASLFESCEKSGITIKIDLVVVVRSRVIEHEMFSPY